MKEVCHQGSQYRSLDYTSKAEAIISKIMLDMDWPKNTGNKFIEIQPQYRLGLYPFFVRGRAIGWAFCRWFHFASSLYHYVTYWLWLCWFPRRLWTIISDKSTFILLTVCLLLNHSTRVADQKFHIWVLLWNNLHIITFFVHITTCSTPSIQAMLWKSRSSK